MRAALSVDRVYSPSVVFVNINIRRAEIYHGLYRQRHAGLKTYSPSSAGKIRDLRIFMQMSPYSMSHKIGNDSVAEAPGVIADCR